MREYDVIAVTGIIVGKLPVALVSKPVRLADRNLSARLAVEPLIDRPGDRAEIFQQRRCIGIESCENESTIAVDARYLCDIEFCILEVTGIAVGPGDGPQLSGIEEAPAVIRALEETSRTFFLTTERGAAMGAAIEQGSDFAVRIPQQNDGAQAQPDRDEVVVPRDLALMPEIHP